MALLYITAEGNTCYEAIQPGNIFSKHIQLPNSVATNNMNWTLPQWYMKKEKNQEKEVTGKVSKQGLSIKYATEYILTVSLPYQANAS